MDKLNNKNTLFKYTRSKINQFEFKEESYTQGGNNEITITISFAVKKIEERYIVCIIDLISTSNNNKFLSSSVSSFFEIEEESWKKLTNEEDRSINIPQYLCLRFISTTMDISRGVMLAKLESTVAESIDIPPISISKITAGDTVVKFD